MSVLEVVIHIHVDLESFTFLPKEDKNNSGFSTGFAPLTRGILVRLRIQLLSTSL